MIAIIKQYEGKLGTVTVTMYEENGRTEYHVKHSCKALCCASQWFGSKNVAIATAQFLAGKY